MTLSSEIGRLEDENAELKNRVHALEQQVAFQAGKLEQADSINAKLQTTISLREQALAVYQLADKINAIEPMAVLPPPQHTNSNLVVPDHERDATMPMPKFLQNQQIPKAQDRRVPRHNAA